MATDQKPNKANGDASRELSKAKWFIYPFFGVHMLMFGLSGFLMAYASEQPDVPFMYLHGGIAIVVYLVFYLVIFGADEVKWMAINAALGVLGIYSQIGWILARFGRQIDDFPWYVHLTPFVYFVLYTFLLRQFLIDVTSSRNNPTRLAIVNNAYVVVSLLVYGWTLWRGPQPGTRSVPGWLSKRAGTSPLAG
ncbi:MAG: hypothetical protein ABIR16_05225 [Dokdonella sp.]